MATEKEWAEAFPIPQAVSFGDIVGRFYGGSRNRFLDDYLDGKIPPLWAKELEQTIPQETLRMRQIERLIARFELAVGKLGEVVRSLEAQVKREKR